MKRWSVMLVSMLPDPCSGVAIELPRPVAAVSIGDPATYWARRGFAEMTPPIRLPSRDGKERIVVWLWIPEGGRIRVEPRSGSPPSLAYPIGTVSDRVDMSDGSDPASVEDVRGTRFERDGEYFHVLRRLDSSSVLSGTEWPRGDGIAQSCATKQMVDRLAVSPRLSGGADREQELSRFERQNECPSCHLPNKRERRFPASADEAEGARCNRGTDAGGLYTIATVLADVAPLETHRARDMNEGDGYVSVTCADSGKADFVVGGRGLRRHYRCADGSVPLARFDMARAFANGDAHARGVCGSRAYLHAHMTEEGRAAFARSFEECAIESSAPGPPTADHVGQTAARH